MRYLFRVLCFGNPIGVQRFIQQAGNVKIDEFASDEALEVWDKEITVENDSCSMEICVLLKENADFDEIIPTTDGILYFIDPSNEMEAETFELIMGILQKLDRMIPLCLILHNPQNYSLTPVNVYAQKIWWEFDNVAIFSYGPHSEKSREAPLISLADAMINNSVPINYEFVWLRLPILIKKTNALVNKGDYRRAGINVESIARIAKKFNETNYFIYAEQSAYLFQQVKEFLRAQHVLADVDPNMAGHFRKAYVDSMVRDADDLFKQRMYTAAAQKYEAAANWANMELKDDQLSTQIYNRAIETWVSACEFQNSFRLLEQLDHLTKQLILSKIATRITQAGNYLISIQKYTHAKSQLYLAVNIYQKEGLFEDLKIVNLKLLDVLRVIMLDAIQHDEAVMAKMTFDEFENIVQNFEVSDPPEISGEITELAKLFINRAEFSVVDQLIPKIENIEEQNLITQLKLQKEEGLVEGKKSYLANLAQEAANRVEVFQIAELKYIRETTESTIQDAKAFEENGNISEASNILIKQAQWLSHAKYSKFANDLYSELLQIYLRANFIREFLEHILILEDAPRQTFLTTYLDAIAESIPKTHGNQGMDTTKRFFDGINKIYRHDELYDGSRRLAGQFIEVLKAEALSVTDQEDARQAISDSLEYLKQAQEISDSLLDGEKITHDETYQKIAQKYIALGDMVQAEAILHKIVDKTIYTDLHQQILDIESQRTEAVTSEVKEKVEAGMTQEQISLLRSRAREAAMSKEERLKKRAGLKRRMFQEGLDDIREGKIDEAITEYLRISETFILRKVIEEGGLAIAIACLLDFARANFDGAQMSLTKGAQKASTSQNVLEESFPIRISRFVIEMYKHEQEDLAKQALAMLDNLPLFQEELDVLGQVTGGTFAPSAGAEVREKRGKEEKFVPQETGGRVAGRISARPSSTAEIDSKSKQGKHDVASTQMELEQEIGSLRMLSLEARNSSAEIMRKRTALRRAFYKDSLAALAKQQFDQATKAYDETAGTLLKRRDYPTLGLVVALGVLSLIQADKPIEQVENKLAASLKALGPNETVVRETFPVRVLFFILKAKQVDAKDQIMSGWKLLENLPLFDEEKSLITRPRKF